jgi:hypothetical protein
MNRPLDLVGRRFACPTLRLLRTVKRQLLCSNGYLPTLPEQAAGDKIEKFAFDEEPTLEILNDGH